MSLSTYEAKLEKKWTTQHKSSGFGTTYTSAETHREETTKRVHALDMTGAVQILEIQYPEWDILSVERTSRFEEVDDD